MDEVVTGEAVLSTVSEGTGGRVSARVWVDGDVTIDWHIAQYGASSGENSSQSTLATVNRVWGGAKTMAMLLDEVAKVCREGNRSYGFEVKSPRLPPVKSIEFTDERFSQHQNVWAEFPKGPLGTVERVWRVESHLGDRPASSFGGSPRHSGPELSVSAQQDDPAGSVDGSDVYDLVVLSDSGGGFRKQPDEWAARISRGASGTTSGLPWCIVNVGGELDVSPNTLLADLVQQNPDRLVAVLPLNVLRRREVRVSRGLSWERIAAETLRELARHPAASALGRCAHVVVVVDTGGALLLTRSKDIGEQHKVRLYFDPAEIEDSWTRERPGKVPGYSTALTAAIAHQLVQDLEEPKVGLGVERGLAAMRRLHTVGFQRSDSAWDCELSFPIEEIARVIAGGVPDGVDSPFVETPVPNPCPDSWSILGAQSIGGLDSGAEQIVRWGLDHGLRSAPRARFNRFETVDRGEIEDFRAIYSLMQEYAAQPSLRPLNIAVFGPPGSGKSFGIAEVARLSVSEGEVELLKFNLSQMTGPDDLGEAIHQVRDVSLRGLLPFVVWDEFDGNLGERRLGWLRHFLAPMQDGTFQIGQLSHPVGKAIFAFAGGTCANFSAFVRAASDPATNAKGPDFVSRLRGHVDIVGPNPRGEDRDADPNFRIRRAILLRSVLTRDRPALLRSNGKTDELHIDRNVMRAFLEVGKYRHGARSLEAIVAMSALHTRSSFERSDLPSADLLDAHVDAREFLGLVDGYVPKNSENSDTGPSELDRLAEAWHDYWVKAKLIEGWGPLADDSEDPDVVAYLARVRKGLTLDQMKQLAEHEGETESRPSVLPFAQLPLTEQETNRHAAREIPARLELLGYYLQRYEPGDAEPGDGGVEPDSKFKIEAIARKEHESWTARKVALGWHFGREFDLEGKTSPHVIEWERLDEGVRIEGRQRVGALSEIVRAGGLYVSRRPESQELSVRIVGGELSDERMDQLTPVIELTFARIERNHGGRPIVVETDLAGGFDLLVAETALRRANTRLSVLRSLAHITERRRWPTGISPTTVLRAFDLATEIGVVMEAPRDSTFNVLIQLQGDNYFPREEVWMERAEKENLPIARIDPSILLSRLGSDSRTAGFVKFDRL